MGIEVQLQSFLIGKLCPKTRIGLQDQRKEMRLPLQIKARKNRKIRIILQAQILRP